MGSHPCEDMCDYAGELNRFSAQLMKPSHDQLYYFPLASCCKTEVV